VCAAVGSMIVNEVVKLIIGIGRTLLGRLATFTALTSSWREYAVSRDPGREPTTELIDYEAFCGVPPRRVSDLQHCVTVNELANMLADRNRGLCAFDLVDVREPAEHALVTIPGARLIPQGCIFSGEALSELDCEREVVVYCAVGIRSAAVVAELKRRGYARVKNVDGGVVAWTKQIEAGRGIRVPASVVDVNAHHGSSHQS
jgi:rhodanese-related sulfurtransferase